MRPWKAEQLGGGYALSSWCERTAAEGVAAEFDWTAIAAQTAALYRELAG